MDVEVQQPGMLCLDSKMFCCCVSLLTEYWESREVPSLGRMMKPTLFLPESGQGAAQPDVLSASSMAGHREVHVFHRLHVEC
jgi:hypothetical protein